MKLKKAIKKTRHSLKWKVVENHGADVDCPRINSDPWKKQHIIDIPSDGLETEILHELGHAWLCENVHESMSTNCLEPNPGISVIQTIRPAMNVANDWFVDGWLMKLVPDLVQKEIYDDFRMVIKCLAFKKEVDLEYFMGAVLTIAQAMEYCNQKPMLSFDLQQAVNVLLEVPPNKPSADKFQQIANNLLKLYSSFSIEPSERNGVACWKVNL